MATSVTVLDQASKDLKRMGKGPERTQVLAGLQRLQGEDAALNIKPLVSAPGWFRLRLGDYRVLYRLVEHPEGDREYLIRRVVHRRDLDRAVDGLPEL